MSETFNPFERHLNKPEPAQARPIAETRVEQPVGSKPTTRPDPQNERTSLDDQSGPAASIPPSSATRTGKAINPFASHVSKKQLRRVRKERPQPVQKLLDWLRDWPHPVIGLRDIVLYGPNSIQNRDHAISLAEILVGHGWLVPVECRCDTKWWRIV
jgi:hypothetical protein